MVVYWSTVLAPFHSVVSATVPRTEAKAVILATTEKMKLIEETIKEENDSDAFNVLLSFSQSTSISEETKEVLDGVRDAWTNTSFSDHSEVVNSIVEGNRKAMKKFQKDVSMINSILTDTSSDTSTDTLPLTNRR